MSRRQLIQAAVLLLVGLLILYGLLRTVHPDQVAEAIRGASVGWILAGVLASIVFLLIRGWRWQIILSASSPGARFADATAVTAIGFAVNAVSPFKLGEVLRMAAIAQRTRVGIGEAGATVVLERVLDVVALLVLAVGAALAGGSSNATDVWRGLAVLSALSLIVGVVAYLMVANPERTLGVATTLSVALPLRLRGRAVRLAASVLRGFRVLRSPRQFIATGVLSLVIWIVPILGGIAYFRSISAARPVLTLFLALTLFTITQAVSVTPASVGTFEGLFVLVLGAFRAGPPNVLTAIAVVSHIGGIVTFLVAGGVAALWLRLSRPGLPVGAERAIPRQDLA